MKFLFLIVAFCIQLVFGGLLSNDAIKSSVTVVDQSTDSLREFYAAWWPDDDPRILQLVGIAVTEHQILKWTLML